MRNKFFRAVVVRVQDVLDDMLGRPSMQGTWFAGVRGTSPWALSSEAKPVARLIVVTSGECLLTSTALVSPMRLAEGDCVIVQAGVSFVLQDDVSSQPVRCDQLSFDDRRQASLDGGGAVTEIQTGRFTMDAADLLMDSLPPIMRIRLDDQADSSIRTTLQLMSMESLPSSIGAGTVSGRLADILFIQVLRAWCDSEQGAHVGWLAALQTPELGTALRAMHRDLAHPWTVAELAALSLMSRSTFAALFKSVTGVSPLVYLTRWRVQRAKALLSDSSMSVLDVAIAVGYESDTALNRAFRKFEQIPPGAWRRRRHDLATAA
jgi:AraC-like DNA-binding protein